MLTVIAYGDTTDWNIDYSNSRHQIASGAARQIYGSSSLRTNVNNKQTNRRKNSNNNNQYTRSTTTQKPRFSDYDDDEYSDQYSHGVIFTEPHQVPPPFDPSFRVIGGVRVPGIESEIYGSRKIGGERHDIDDDWKPWDRFDTRTDNGIKSNHPSIIHPESDIMQMPDSGAHMIDDETDEHRSDQPCTLGCLNSEFLCPHSCMCVPKYTRCDEEINCSPYGEDEDHCTQSNLEIIRNIKKECEASSFHVMCPKTFACIAKEFLCDGKLNKSRRSSKEMLKGRK